MSKRHKIPAKQSKKSFTKHAQSYHPKNNIGSSGSSMAMRGGIRF